MHSAVPNVLIGLSCCESFKGAHKAMARAQAIAEYQKWLAANPTAQQRQVAASGNNSGIPLPT